MDDNKLTEMMKRVFKQEQDKASRLGSFTDRKVTDTPTDDLATVNRQYVTLNGTTRPASPVIGQFFLDMNLASGRGKPIWYNGTNWVDATGTIV